MESMRRLRHWRIMTLSSTSATLCQLPCVGVVDELEAIPERLGLGGFEGLVERAGAVRVEVVHHQRDPGGVLGYCAAMSRRKRAQSVFALRSVTLVWRRPASGSVAMNTLQVPRRRYS